ncbi:MAG: hypothetical protein R3C18_02385 [Planctomycetaceae bacterium]
MSRTDVTTRNSLSIATGLFFIAVYCHAALAQVSGAAFQLACGRSVSIAGGDSPLLDVLSRVGNDQQVAILLDRRIDPTQLVGSDLRRMKLQTLVGNLAAQAEGGLSIVGDTFYIGPSTNIRRLRTLIELRERELREASGPARRRLFELLHRKELRWEDLSEPRQLVADLADQYQLQVEGIDTIPHDLWRRGLVTHSNGIESMLLLLTQFDLSFEWMQNFEGIRIVPVPAAPTVDRTHTPRGLLLPDATQATLAAFPDVVVKPSGKTLQITATVEEHEALEVLLGEKKPESSLPARKPVVLANQRFTLRSRGQRFDLVLEALILDGVDIEYDAEAFEQENIDLTSPVQLDLQQATIQQLMDAMTAQVAVDYTIRQNKVILEPRSSGNAETSR